MEKVRIIMNYNLNLFFLGAFGNVIYAWLKTDKKKKVAIKAMKKHDIITSKHVDHIENEKKILEMMNHPFIVSTIVIIIRTHFLTLLFFVDELLRFYAR